MFAAMNLRILSIAALTLLLALAPTASGFVARGPANSAHAFEAPERESGFTPKPLVKAKKHMVVAAHPLAAEAGLAILRKGGSAVDAGIAAQIVLNLVEPQSSGIGGGGFILYWDNDTNTLASFDGRETAPAAATPELFLDRAGTPFAKEKAMWSGLSVGVPGLLAALELAHNKYGRLPWAELFKAAIALAREGFSVSPRLAKLLAEADPDTFAPEAHAYFFDTQGRPWPTGYKLANPELAETFAAIARDGPQVLYEGDIARDIALAVQTDPRGTGKLSPADLASYRAKQREALCVPYRAFEVCGAGPPSSGGASVAQVLGLIAPFDLGNAPLQPVAIHLITEAERLAFADRARYLADPDFVTVPVAGLLDQTYLAERRALIDPAHALKEVTAGTPPNARQGAFGMDRTQESVGTSHISIVDDDGNAFSMTSSIENAFGARTMVHGFLLNNQLTDFSFLPVDEDGRPAANRVEPNKRPRSSMNPTIVFAGGRQLRYVLGSPGGPAIIPFNVKAIVALIDWGLDPAKASALANFGSAGTGNFLLEEGAPFEPLAEAMAAMGHDVHRRDLTSGLHIIALTPEGLEGGADPRREGLALGD
jgi:gamma-glutamyltranspeptidase/glutathione hydrolase